MLTIEEKDGKKILMLDGYPVEVGDRVWDSYYAIWRTITDINYGRGEMAFDIRTSHFHIGSLNHIFWQPPERPPKPTKPEQTTMKIEDDDGIGSVTVDSSPVDMGNGVWRVHTNEGTFLLRGDRIIKSITSNKKKIVKKWQWLYRYNNGKFVQITDEFYTKESIKAELIMTHSRYDLIGPCLESEIEVEE